MQGSGRYELLALLLLFFSTVVATLENQERCFVFSTCFVCFF